MTKFNSADIAAFKDVWVFCEQREGKLMPTDLELISKGRDLADELGVELCGLLLTEYPYILESGYICTIELCHFSLFPFLR